MLKFFPPLYLQMYHEEVYSYYQVFYLFEQEQCEQIVVFMVVEGGHVTDFVSIYSLIFLSARYCEVFT